jgi:hypothetical protein
MEKTTQKWRADADTLPSPPTISFLFPVYLLPFPLPRWRTHTQTNTHTRILSTAMRLQAVLRTRRAFAAHANGLQLRQTESSVTLRLTASLSACAYMRGIGTDKTTLWGDISTLPDNFASPRGVGANVHTLVHNQSQAQGQEAGALIYVPHQVIVVSDRGVYEDLKARNHNIPRSADGAGSADVVFVEGGIQVLLGGHDSVCFRHIIVYCSLCARAVVRARERKRERESQNTAARGGGWEQWNVQEQG